MKVPGHVAQGRRAPFPPGIFVGSLKAAQANYDESGTAALLLTFRDIAPGDADSPNVNGRPKSQRVQIIDKNPKNPEELVMLADIAEFNDDVPLSLQRSATLLTQLALAFGVGTASPNGDVDVDMGTFLEDLENNVYADADVVFEVTHRPWYPKGAKKVEENKRVSDDIIRFAAVQAAEAAPAPAPVAAAPAATAGARLRGRGR